MLLIVLPLALTICLADAVTDRDGDGIPDARELELQGDAVMQRVFNPLVNEYYPLVIVPNGPLEVSFEHMLIVDATLTKTVKAAITNSSSFTQTNSTWSEVETIANITASAEVGWKDGVGTASSKLSASLSYTSKSGSRFDAKDVQTFLQSESEARELVQKQNMQIGPKAGRIRTSVNLYNPTGHPIRIESLRATFHQTAPPATTQLNPIAAQHSVDGALGLILMPHEQQPVVIELTGINTVELRDAVEQGRSFHVALSSLDYEFVTHEPSLKGSFVAQQAISQVRTSDVHVVSDDRHHRGRIAHRDLNGDPISLERAIELCLSADDAIALSADTILSVAGISATPAADGGEAQSRWHLAADALDISRSHKDLLELPIADFGGEVWLVLVSAGESDARPFDADVGYSKIDWATDDQEELAVDLRPGDRIRVVVGGHHHEHVFAVVNEETVSVPPFRISDREKHAMYLDTIPYHGKREQWQRRPLNVVSDLNTTGLLADSGQGFEPIRRLGSTHWRITAPGTAECTFTAAEHTTIKFRMGSSPATESLQIGYEFDMHQKTVSWPDAVVNANSAQQAFSMRGGGKFSVSQVLRWRTDDLYKADPDRGNDDTLWPSYYRLFRNELEQFVETQQKRSRVYPRRSMIDLHVAIDRSEN